MGKKYCPYCGKKLDSCSHDSEVMTKEMAEELGYPIYTYLNGDWEYKDEKGYEHLMREIDGEWRELTEDVKATGVYSYPNGDWEYEDAEGYQHLFREIDGYIWERKYKLTKLTRT